jgi:hypothetical protein
MFEHVFYVEQIAWMLAIQSRADFAAIELDDLQLTEAQRSDARNYQTGHIVQFTQNAPGFKRGERFAVVDCTGGNVTVQDATGARKALPLGMSKHFQLYTPEQISLAAGDRVRITQNRFAKTGQRLNNGSLHEIAGIAPNGEIKLKNGAVLAKDFGHLTHGYCVTSYASQSKTVNVPLVAQSSLSFNASSLEQVYVSLSRGNEGIRIYTDDLKELRERVARSTARGGAMDLAGDIPEHGLRRTMPDIPVEMRRAWCAWQKRKEKAAVRSYEKEIHTSRGTSKGGKGRGRGLELAIGL